MEPTPLSPSATKRLYHLFGFPIAHSASPALHNYLFSRLGLRHRTYKLTPMTCVGLEMRALCASEEFGGASVTMPLKVSVASMVDRVTEEARAIGAVNTLVPERDEQGRTQLIGTNTDWLGIRNVLLRHLQPAGIMEPESRQANNMAALVIGGGGAARAAVYALVSLHCTPIYLVGRDTSELTALVTQYPHFPCVPVSDPTSVVNIKIAIGCVPALAPITPEEIAADTCIREIFSYPSLATWWGGNKRIFLDMCYKPRTTPLMLHAELAGWTVISGIEAMLEQGFAQARMWLAESVDCRLDTVGLIPGEIERDARTYIRMMPDIIVPFDEGSLGVGAEPDC